MSAKKIHTVVTRYANSSLEGPALAALLAQGRNIPNALGFSKSVEFQFKSTARLRIAWPPPTAAEFKRIRDRQRASGTILFNVGDEYGCGHYDHHGDPTTASLTSLDRLWVNNGVVEEGYSHLVDPLLAISGNDAFANALSPDKDNLRRLMQAMAVSHPQDWNFQHGWLDMAIRGVFAQHKATGELNNAFSMAGILQGLAVDHPTVVNDLESIWQTGVEALLKDRKTAREDVKQAMKRGQFAWISHPALSPKLICRNGQTWSYGGKLKVVWVRSDAVNAAKVCRDKWNGGDADIAIILRSTGHYQVFQRITLEHALPEIGAKEPGKILAKYKLTLGPLARALRLAEANLVTPRRILIQDMDWTNDAAVYDTDGNIVPWYLGCNQTLLVGNTLSSPDMPPSVIRHDKVVDLICDNLPNCGVITQDNETDDWS
ncbi:MAG: hypothetical protein PHW95_01775 [Patescibacteria group bacterium]|nr:hypothetical protein [Patescibacteria group bacterium]